MIRVLALLAPLLLGACTSGTSETPPPSLGIQAPAVTLGGSMRGYYGNPVQ